MAWEVKKLGDVCEVLDSKRKPITKKDRISGEYPYYGATGILDYVHDYIFDEKLILIGEDGAKWCSGDNTAFIATGKYWVNNHAHVIRPNRKIILDEWIIYFLNFSDLSNYITGLTVPKLNQEKMRSIDIPVPPLSIQKKIVEVLDSAFEKISKAKENSEANLNNAKDIYISFLRDFFTEVVKNSKMEPLGKYNDVVVGYVGPISHAYTTDITKPKLLSTKNISDSGINLDKATYVTEDFHNKYNKSRLKEGDILVARHGNSGQSSVIPRDFGEAHALNVIIIKKGKLTDSHYISLLLNSKVLEKITNSRAGSVQKIINTKVIKDLILPVPNVEEQKAIVSKLDNLSEQTKQLESIYSQKLNCLEELKQSILQKAFKGELTEVSS